MACLLSGCCWCSPALAVITVSGNGNTTGQSLIDANGPGDAGQIGFANVGLSTTKNASATYLANGWAISARHVTIGSTVTFGGIEYNVDPSSITHLQNSDNSPADLQLFRLETDPGLPQITADLISDTTPSGRQIMIGNGLDSGSQLYWNVDKAGSWTWNEAIGVPSPGPDVYSGFVSVDTHHIRWGENEVNQTGLFETTSVVGGVIMSAYGYSTRFDDPLYGHVNPGDNPDTTQLPSEALLSQGDSGGAVFEQVGGTWKLAGLMVSFHELYIGQPLNTANEPYAVFGNQSYIIDLSAYRDQIIQIVPEPGGLALATTACAALGLFWRRQRRPAGRSFKSRAARV